MTWPNQYQTSHHTHRHTHTLPTAILDACDQNLHHNNTDVRTKIFREASQTNQTDLQIREQYWSLILFDQMFDVFQILPNMISIKQGGQTTKCLVLQFSQRIVFIYCRLVGMVWKQEPEATWIANICSLSLWSTEALVWGRSWTMLPFCSSVTHESDWDYSSMTSTSITCLLQLLFGIIITNKG